MYQDNSLIPNKAARLLALGVLATGERRYADLASEVRQFIGRIVGPSLDVVASPLELLKVEGLIESAEPARAEQNHDSELLRITDSGRAELLRLLSSNVRPPVTEFNRLVIALKMRFLHFLDGPAQERQLDVLIQMSQRELERLQELSDRHAREDSHFAGWLAHEIDQSRKRVNWFRERLKKQQNRTPAQPAESV